MMRHIFAIGFILTAANISLAQSATTKIAASKGWLNNLDAAQALAQKTGKPLMVVFRCDP